MPETDDRMKQVAYCGLYCGLCSTVCRIPERAESLRASLAKEGFNVWGMEMPGFKPFWEYLEKLASGGESCPGCRQGGGNPQCEIRVCAREKGVDVCVDCTEFPCKKTEVIMNAYPSAESDARRMKEVGLDKWLREQDARAKTGFAYCDIRRYEHDVKDV